MRLKNCFLVLVILSSTVSFAIESSTKVLAADSSAMVVEDIIDGSGPVVQMGSKVVVNYAISTEEGTALVDKTPFTFRIGSSVVLSLWNEGLLGMKVGGRRTLSVASKDIILSGVTASRSSAKKLIYEIELVSLENGNIAAVNKKAKSN